MRYERLEDSYVSGQEHSVPKPQLSRRATSVSIKGVDMLQKQATSQLLQETATGMNQSGTPATVPCEDWEDWVGRANGVWFPRGQKKLVWDLLLLIGILYNCVSIPFRLGMGEAPTGGWLYFEAGITLFFLTDVFLNFNVAYTPDDVHYVIDRPMIARNYLCGWFLIDFPSSLPLELLEILEYEMAFLADDDGSTEHLASLKMLRALRLLRLLRLLKVLKMQKYVHLFEDATDINVQIMTLVKLLIGVVYLTHMLGCVWFYLHLSVYRPTTAALEARGSYAADAHVAFEGEEAGDEMPTTWLTSYDDGSGLSKGVWAQYLYSVYWALMTLTTVGYGDITPTNDAERVYTLFCLLVGAIVFGFLLSTLGDVLSNVDQNATRVEEKLTEVKEYLRWHRVPVGTAKSVRKYYEYFLSRRSTVDDETILKNLTPSLRREVTIHLLEKSVARIPLFTRQGASKNTYVDMALQLRAYELLKPVVREAKEAIFTKHSLSEGLFFLSRGNVTASGDLGLPYFHVKEPGTIFGEHALLEKPAEFSAIAQVRCELFAIDKSDLATLAATRSDAGRDELAENILDEYYRHSVMRNVALRLLSAGISQTLTNQERVALRMQRGFYVLQLKRLCGEGAPSLDELLPALYGLEGRTVDTHYTAAIAERGVPLALHGAPQNGAGEPPAALKTLKARRMTLARPSSAFRVVQSPSPSPAARGASPTSGARGASADQTPTPAAGTGLSDDRGGLSSSLEQRIADAVEAAVAKSSLAIEEQVRAKLTTEGEGLKAAAGDVAELARGLKVELRGAVSALDSKVDVAIERMLTAAAAEAKTSEVGKRRSSLLSPRGWAQRSAERAEGGS